MTSSFWSRGLIDLVGLLGVDDRDDRHVAVADHEADVLVGDLAERAQALHALRADLHLQHVGQADAREDLVARERGLEQQVDDAFGLGQEARAAAGRGPGSSAEDSRRVVSPSVHCATVFGESAARARRRAPRGCGARSRG